MKHLTLAFLITFVSGLAFASEGWGTDYEAALKQAKAEKKVVLLDFPSKKKIPEATKIQNEKLSKKFKVSGFPTIILLDGDGQKIAQTGYQAAGAAAYVRHLKELIAKEKK